MALVDIDSRKHTGVISYFDKYFVKTGLFEKSFSMIAHNAFDSRQISDYQDFQMPTPEQAKKQFDDAVLFIAVTEKKQELFFKEKLSLPST